MHIKLFKILTKAHKIAFSSIVNQNMTMYIVYITYNYNDKKKKNSEKKIVAIFFNKTKKAVSLS